MVLSEIMYNPDGNESTDEFVEIYNDSHFAVNLAGWQISDGEGTDSLVSFDDDLWTLPGQFVLILDPDYFADSSTTYDGFVPSVAKVVTLSNSTFGSRGFSNSTAECVSILNDSGRVVSEYCYSLGNDDGHSDEKIFLTNGDDIANWTNSILHHGTPGKSNSVTPPLHDLAVIRFTATPAAPAIGDTFVISVTVQNLGYESGQDSLSLSRLHPADSSMEHLHSWFVSGLAFRDSVVLTMKSGAGRWSLTGVYSCSES